MITGSGIFTEQRDGRMSTRLSENKYEWGRFVRQKAIPRHLTFVFNSMYLVKQYSLCFTTINERARLAYRAGFLVSLMDRFPTRAPLVSC